MGCDVDLRYHGHILIPFVKLMHLLPSVLRLLAVLPALACAVAAAEPLPNIILINCDDLGYGDLA